MEGLEISYGIFMGRPMVTVSCTSPSLVIRGNNRLICESDRVWVGTVASCGKQT